MQNAPNHRRLIMTRTVFWLLGLVGATALATWSGGQAAAAYPDKPIKLVVPFTPGTSTDLVAREYARALSEVIGQPVVVENRAGAEGVVGGRAVATADKDGYTALYTSSSLTVLDPHMRKDLQYDPLKDLAPVCTAVQISIVMNINADLPYKSIADVVAAAKAQPGNITFAYSSATTRLTGELFQQLTSTKLAGIPYRSAAQGLTDVAAGRVAMYFIDALSARPHYQSGKIRPLAMAASARGKLLPDVPSAAEAGLPGLIMTAWAGAYLPPRRP
jgi:tripartite-type tricarboxylate transporter receptor subunit TctC